MDEERYFSKAARKRPTGQKGGEDRLGDAVDHVRQHWHDLRLDPGIEHAKFVARRDMWLKLPAGSAAPHRALLMWLPLPQSRSAYIGRGTTLVVSPHVMHRIQASESSDLC